MKTLKTTLELHFGVATVKRISSRERWPRIKDIFEGVSSHLVPTHFGEERRCKPFEMARFADVFKHHMTSTSLGGVVTLQCRGMVRGEYEIVSGRGPLSPSSSIEGRLRYDRINKLKLMPDAIRMFTNMMDIADGAYGFVRVEAQVKSYWLSMEDLTRPIEPSVLNGVRVGMNRVIALTLRCLPTLGSAWIHVLGREYIDLLGRERLELLNVAKRRIDDGGRMWLQMTDRPEQIYDPAFQSAVEAQSQLLQADDIFCRPGRSPILGDEKPYRTPEFDRSEIRTEGVK